MDEKEGVDGERGELKLFVLLHCRLPKQSVGCCSSSYLWSRSGSSGGQGQSGWCGNEKGN